MKPDEQITLQDIIDWTVREATQNPDVVRRIEADIKQSDSLVREYLDWEAGMTPGITPRLVEEHIREPGVRESFEKAMRELAAENDRFFANRAREPYGKHRTK